MTKELKCDLGGYERFVVDDIVIAVSRDRDGNAKVVVHPPSVGKAVLKTAVRPYCCVLWFGSGTDPEYTQPCDLGDEGDWGEIDPECLGRPKCGNEEDGYRYIARVTLGDEDGEEIPLRRFSEDVMDLIALHLA